MANKILLADDSITIQKVVNLTFTDEGINVVTVGNGELALKKLGEESFDLVLADIFMPGRNGYEVCEYVKASPEMRDIPVILLVGAFEPFDKSEAARVRADGHLTKPFESRILIETVKRMLAEAAVRHAAAAPPAAAEPAYKGQVVGWDVPTAAMVPQHIEEDEPEPPPYDPYASTAKLPAIPKGLVPEDAAASADRDMTSSFGTPLSTGALFTDGPAEASADRYELAEPEPAPMPATRAMDGPPDEVAGFSYHVEDDTDSHALSAEPAERPSISYQEIPSTDSPLDLPELAVVESHTHDVPYVEERRDPLLETFADVSESTSGVAGSAAPGLEVNEHADVAPSMTVGATENIISAWDPQAQPPAPVESAELSAAPDDEAPTVPAGQPIGQTQPFSVEAAPFGFAGDAADEVHEMAVPDIASAFDLPAGTPEPSEVRPPAKPTLGLADLAGLATYRGGNATERFTPSDVEDIAADHSVEARAEVDVRREETPAAEAPSWTPDVEPVEAAEVEAGANVVEDAVDAIEAPAEALEVEAAAADDEVAAAAEPFELEEEPAVEAVEAEPVEAAADDVATPVDEPVEALGAAAAAEAAVSPNGSSGAHGIPQGVIDEVVRRTMERLNDDVIREIAWEVVPQLAESLIKKRLGEGAS